MKYIIQVYEGEINGHGEKEGLPTEFQYEFEQEMLKHVHDLKKDLREKGWWERDSPEVSQTSFLRSENSDAELGFKNMNKKVMDEFKSKVKNPSVFKELTHLRKYSFAKGHSIAYGQMVWALAYHKVRRPKEFWEATLKHNQSSYKKWVHKREALNNGVWLRNDYRGSVYDQFTKSGWWDSYEFLPHMGMEREGNQIWFNGIVGNFRKLRRGKWSCVLMSIGVGNERYLDLIINSKKKRFPFGYYMCIEGWGIEKEENNSQHIEVEDFRCYNLRGSTEHKLEKFFK